MAKRDDRVTPLAAIRSQAATVQEGGTKGLCHDGARGIWA